VLHVSRSRSSKRASLRRFKDYRSFALGFKKAPITHREFWTKIPPILKVEVEKVFRIMSEVWEKSENIFFTEKSACYPSGNFRKNPRFFNLKLDFFPVIIFPHFFPKYVGKYLTYLNFKFVNLKKTSENFFLAGGREIITRQVVQVKELRYAASRLIWSSLLVSRKRRLPIRNLNQNSPDFESWSWNIFR